VRTPELGCFGLVRTGGWAAVGIRVMTQSPVNHAFVYVGPQTFGYVHDDGTEVHYVDEPAIVEANPAGAGLTPVSAYGQVIWSEPPPQGMGYAVANAALALLGTPYSWVDDAAIGIAKLSGWHVPDAVRHRLNRKDRLMCSQLVDTACGNAGWVLYSDHRMPGDVSPGDLLVYILATRAGEVDPCTWRG